MHSEWLDQLDKGRRSVFLCRHGERGEVAKGTFGLDVLLTPQGKKDAEALGHRLKGVEIDQIVTSPIQRCIETAQGLKSGYQKEISVVSSTSLGGPGPFTVGPELAGPLFLSLPLVEIMDRLSGGDSLPGLCSMEEGSRRLLDFITAQEGGVAVMVSHDVIIALFCCYVFGGTRASAYTPHFLEGCFIEIDRDAVTISYRDQRTVLQRESR